jgi:hypothetical protein
MNNIVEEKYVKKIVGVSLTDSEIILSVFPSEKVAKKFREYCKEKKYLFRKH